MTKKKQHKYSDLQKQFVAENCTLIIGELTAAFNAKFGTNISKSAMHATRKRLKARTGRTGHFEKGVTSWNKGLKGLQVGGRSAETQFKKGHISPNLKPIGHERICSKDGITLIKVAEPNPYTGSATRYRPKHHVVWEAANGPIPKGMVVRFVDGDKANVNLDNLEMVTKKLNLQLNRTGYSQLPTELKPVAKTACQIQVKIFERDKQL